MVKRLAKFIDEFTAHNKNGGFCSEAQCKEYPKITRRVHVVFYRGRSKTFRQYFVKGKKYLGFLDGFPDLKLAIKALK